MRYPSWLGVVCAVSLLGLGACQKGNTKKPEGGKAASTEASVRLPPPPNLQAAQGVTRYPDGSYSVEGLLQQGEAVLRETITVKGFVVERRICNPDEPTCRQPPHALVADKTGDTKRTLLVVADSERRIQALEPGQPVVLEGMFEQVSPDGRFIRASGLLVLKPEPRVEPPPPPGPDAAAGPATAPAAP